MKSRIFHNFRTGRLLRSAMWTMAADDPQQFLSKVYQRLLQSPLRLFVRRLPAPRTTFTTPQRLFAEGHLSELAAYSHPDNTAKYRKLNRADKHRVARAQERLDMLTREVPTVAASAPTGIVGSTGARKPTRVLFYLTNSLPHTQSGYTYRSHSTLAALQSTGVGVSAMTRLAYPLVVGKWAIRSRETVEGITYARQLPANYPSTLQERHALAVNLLVEEAKRTEASIFHTTTDYNNALVVADAAARLDLPWVYEVRGELESTWLSRHSQDKQEELVHSDFYRLSRAQETTCMQSASAVVALSEVSRQLLIERGVPEAKITVVPNAVDDTDISRDFNRDSIRQELGLPDATIVGSVTSVVGYEGLDTLLEAAASVPDLYVLIVGDGQARSELEKLARQLEIDDRVIFAGRQPNATIWKWYAALDAFIVPRKDTTVCRRVTPIKTLLAQGLGIPIIASDLPALREITGDVATYVPPENPSVLAGALRNLQSMPPADTSRGIDWASEHTWKANARRYSKLYDLLLS